MSMRAAGYETSGRPRPRRDGELELLPWPVVFLLSVLVDDAGVSETYGVCGRCFCGLRGAAGGRELADNVERWLDMGLGSSPEDGTGSVTPNGLASGPRRP